MALAQTGEIPNTRVNWARALKALGTVLRDTSRSDKVAELAVALEGSGLERCFQRFKADPAGRELLKKRTSLFGALKDREKFAGYPQDTLGYAYYQYMNQERLDAEAFTQITQVFNPDGSEPLYDEERRFFRDRIRDSHDVWHALTGYGADELGEAALLTFSQAQIPNLGVGVLASAAFFLAPLGIPNDRLGWQPYMLRAYVRGLRASWLPVAPIEDLLEKPLADVQRQLGIEPTRIAHPKGLYRYSRGDRKVRRVFLA